ncbi:MAG: hypothetical protein KDJ36_09080 [Hyphomicrobiaceae bacterium]|nr:hypothetical protein [Hyphomicrobiaceae bacterium]
MAQAPGKLRIEPTGWLFAVVLTTGLSLVGSPAASDPRGGDAATPNSCAQAYHLRLKALAPVHIARMSAALERARAPEAGWPGKWRFWDPHRHALRRKLMRVGYGARVIVIENQMCANAVIGQGGRIRCLKWVPKPKNYVPPKLPAATDPGEAPIPEKAELGRLRAIAGFVRAGGALTRLRRPQPLYHLTHRMSSELSGYLTQPRLATLCTGASAMLAFYEGKLQTIQALAGAARAQRQASWVAAQNTNKLLAGSALPDDKAKAVAMMQAALVALAARFMTRERLSALRGEPDPIAALAVIESALKTPAAQESAPNSLASARFALRNLETAYYAYRRAAKYEAVAQALSSTIDAIRGAHAATCSCSR